MQDQTPSKFRRTFLTVTPLSKMVALAFLVLLPFIGFGFGSAYQKSITIPEPENIENTAKSSPIIKKYGFRVLPVPDDVTGIASKELFKYQLLKNDEQGNSTPIFTVVNLNGFVYEVSPEGNFIAIIVYGKKEGEEVFTIIDTDGNILRDFGHLNAMQALIPMGWFFDESYYISAGLPGADYSKEIIKVNAPTLKITRFKPGTTN